jgi:hypothetical protein
MLKNESTEVCVGRVKTVNSRNFRRLNEDKRIGTRQVSDNLLVRCMKASSCSADYGLLMVILHFELLERSFCVKKYARLVLNNSVQVEEKSDGCRKDEETGSSGGPGGIYHKVCPIHCRLKALVSDKNL